MNTRPTYFYGLNVVSIATRFLSLFTKGMAKRPFSLSASLPSSLPLSPFPFLSSSLSPCSYIRSFLLSPSLLLLILSLASLSRSDVVDFDHSVGIENCQTPTSSSSSLHFTAGMYTVKQSPAAGFMRSSSYIEVGIGFSF